MGTHSGGLSLQEYEEGIPSPSVCVFFPCSVSLIFSCKYTKSTETKENVFPIGRSFYGVSKPLADEEVDLRGRLEVMGTLGTVFYGAATSLRKRGCFIALFMSHSICRKVVL